MLEVPEITPFPPQGPRAHKTRMFLLSSYWAGPGPWTAPFLGPGLGPWPLALALDHHDQDDDDYVVTT